ncbi:MAG: AAA family ATPase [Gammaproteobacteria bacterium]|nr:AAA family ATPase [Gammaproteobacteria bacterium]
MTLPGGSANKLGNRYEMWWTLSELVRMLAGETEAIRIEDPGVDKAEFVVTMGARRELHQAKRSHPNGKWSLAALRDEGLLQAIDEQLAGNDDRFVFASGSDARELAELCDAARAAESDAEFDRRFLDAAERRKRFEKLLVWWACDVPTARERLRRIDVRTIDERGLRDNVHWSVAALFLAKPAAVVAALRGIAEDSVHRTISRQDLVEELGRRGLPLRHVRNPEHAVAAVQTATDRYLDIARRKLIRQALLSKAATVTLLSRLDGTPSDSVVTGRAGSGKTACVVEIVERLRERDLSALAFRLDRIPFHSVSTTAALGEHLGLEESPSLVLAAAAEATGRPSVLIIDQLDAVSTISGRSSVAFDLVAQLIHEARGARARVVIHTIVVCRAFDWANDSRLRQLMPPDSQAQVEVAEFTVDEVKTILTDAGFDPTLFQPRQLELLRLPQNLSLFLDAGFDVAHVPAFGTANVLFDRYWEAKRQSVADQVAPSSDRWLDMIETLCDEMAAVQQLSVAREKLDRFSSDYLKQMASEGVLTFDGRRYGFGHESFFDYCFARLFVARSESLIAFLDKSEQHLFRRAQVRQVFAYLRDADRDRYVRELAGLLSDEGIRPHIKELAFALLAEVTDPTEDEWAIWEEWTAPALKAIEEGTPNPDKLSALAWRKFFGSAPWFAFVDRRGVVESWLDSGNDQLTNLAMSYLNVHHRHSPDRAATLLEPCADRGGQWSVRLRNFMQWAELHKSRRFFDLFLHLVDNGTLDEAGGPIAVNSTFWSMLYGLSENCPEWIPEVLAHRLRRRLAVMHAAGETLGNWELLGYDDSVVEMTEKSATQAPAAYVEHVLPVVLEISDSALTGDEPPKHDAVWPVLIKSEFRSGEDACLAALAGALATLARGGSTDLRDVIADLRRRDTHIANHLLLALYAGGAARHADETTTLFCTEPWRFQCGFSDSEHWCAREAIRAVSTHCTDENRERLEVVILQYVPPYERTSHGYRQSGRAQFALLSAIPDELRSRRAHARFKELERKFGEPEGEPRGITGGFVGPPIKQDAAEKMTDGQWLRAIAKYRSEDRMHFASDGVTGGGRQLAQVLEKRASEDPERFARLGLRFPEDTNPVYLERTLAGLKGAATASEVKLQVCRKAFGVSRGHCGKSIADVLGSIEDPLPDDAIEMLHWLATEHDDPATELRKVDAPGGEKYYRGDIHTVGINSTRGRAAIAVWDLILRDAAYVERFRPTVDRLVQDPSVAVLSCVAGTLRAVAYRDRALSMQLFLDMNLSDERLLATRHVYRFIQDRLHDSFAELRPIAVRMLRSSEPEVCETGARLASLALLMAQNAADLVDEALHGGTRHRLGVTQVASANIATPECRRWSEEMLVELFNDDDAAVRRKAASCFRHLKDEDLDTYGELIATFCDSKAFQEDSFPILHALEESLGRLPGTTCLVCEKFLNRFADEARDIRTHRAGDSPTVATLIFRTYQQHQDDEWTARSLNLIDHLCLEGIGDAGSHLDQFER